MEKTVLVIEDDKILQSAILEAMNDAELNAIAAGDGKTGLELAKSKMPAIILLDLVLPKMDGYKLLYELKHDDSMKHIPIICLTAIGSESSIAECKAHGAADYLVKADYSLDQIVEKVKKHL